MRCRYNYIWCLFIMQDIRVGTSLSSSSLVPTRRDNVVNGCSKPTRCTEQCPDLFSECHIGWEESTCVCNEGESTCTANEMSMHIYELL